jgi:hypothetical protein
MGKIHHGNELERQVGGVAAAQKDENERRFQLSIHV